MNAPFEWMFDGSVVPGEPTPEQLARRTQEQLEAMEQERDWIESHTCADCQRFYEHCICDWDNPAADDWESQRCNGCGEEVDPNGSCIARCGHVAWPEEEYEA